MHQEDDETFSQVIKDSKKKLQTLKILADFFNHPVLIAVLIRTRVIHNLFENNRHLDVNRLDLFNVQYTNSLIELFQKLKKAKEQSYLLISDEIYINEDFIRKLKLEIDTRAFSDVAFSHARNFSLKLEELYKIFAFGQKGIFSWNEITEFSSRRASEFYREIGSEEFKQINCHGDRPVYSNQFIKVEKKLMGRLNIYKFKIKFACGIKCGNETAEVYEFIDSNDRFIFNVNGKSLYFLNADNARGIDLSKNKSVKTKIIEDLEEKNIKLKEEQINLKTRIPKDVEDVLKSYAAKISDVEFLNDLQNVDEQTNILKAMLNININQK
ncbi:MAG TPA: hypothetical protein VFR70_11280 [Flavobacterium sp.]|nr:hypothetical protein [Flavobacterium sp.]